MALRERIVADLFASLHETLALFDQNTDVLNRAYAPGKWNLRQMLVHLSDTETVLLDRLRRILADEQPSLLAFDQDRWEKHLSYNTRDLILARQQFESARRSVIELARMMPEAFDSKVGVHTEAGPLTFAQVLEKTAKHTAHHLDQARAIVAGKTWSPSK